MASYDYVVIGAGPAGAAFAHLASEKGYRVLVLDQAPWPGFKACGWAVPRQIERTIRIPTEVILTEIKRFRVYLDGRPVQEGEEGLWGFIIDKRSFLEYLVSNAELKTKTHVEISFKPRPRVVDDKAPKPSLSYVLAPGSSGLSDTDLIYAVQVIARTSRDVDPEMVELYFERSLVGYYWVFPRGTRVLDIGVGGYRDPKELVEMLKKFTEKLSEERGGLEVIEGPKGAWINVGGVNTQFFNATPPVIGEAAGFVYPITGEGIRPSIVSAAAAFNRLEGRSLPREFDQTVRWIGIQRKLLDMVKKSSPDSRARIIETLPLELFIGIGLGELSFMQLLRALPRLPRGVASVLKEALKGLRR